LLIWPHNIAQTEYSFPSGGLGVPIFHALFLSYLSKVSPHIHICQELESLCYILNSYLQTGWVSNFNQCDVTGLQSCRNNAK